MGDEPGLVMSVGVDSYEAHSYEIKIDILLSNYKNRALVSSLSRFVKTCLSAHAGRTGKNQQDSREDGLHGGDTPLVMNQTAI